MYTIYQVMNSEDLESIAMKFGTTADFLKNINGIPDGYFLTPGISIIVPNNQNEMYFKYVVKSGDTLYAIANKYNVPLDTLVLLNGLEKNEYIYPNQELMVPGNNINVYVTKEETLNDVLNKLNIGLDDLVGENDNIYLAPDQLIVYKKEKLY